MKNKKYIPGAIGCFIALLLIIALAFGTKFTLETNARLDSMETEQERLQEFVTVKVADLKTLINDHEKRIDINFRHINHLTSQLIDIKISKDSISETSFYFIIDEIWTELERLERVK